MKFTNPLYKRRPEDTAPQGQPDPYIIKHNGMFYIYATHDDGVQLYTSADFSDWKYEGICCAEAGKKDYWAPAVTKIDGRFYLYYSCMDKNSDNAHTQAIRVAAADKPEGPYVFQKVLLEPFSIDPHVVDTPSGLFMFYSVNDFSADRAGTLIVVDRMLDPCTPEKKPVPAVLPTLDEEIFEHDRFHPGQHWHTVEGAFYFREGDWHYLTYSGSAYTKERYFIGYASAYAPGAPDLRQLKFLKRPAPDIYKPLISKNGAVEGTGHNSVIRVGGDYYIVYHGRAAGVKHAGDARTMRADKLAVRNGELSIC
jgi:beta-xylosidase